MLFVEVVWQIIITKSQQKQQFNYFIDNHGTPPYLFHHNDDEAKVAPL